MNAFWIKVIAIASMLIDHFALFYFPDSYTLQILGRISFPLIAWLIANGAIYTSNIDRYLLRLGVFAFLAQIPYEIGYYYTGQHPLFLNVLFTLFLGLLTIRLWQRDERLVVRTSTALVMLILANVLHVDYGALGVLSILAFYLYMDRPHMMVASQVFILFILSNLGFFIAPELGRLMMHPLEAWGVIALPIILLYNKKRGLATGLFFYWFFVFQAFAILTLKILSR